MTEPLLTLTAVSKYYTAAQSVVVGLNSVDLNFHAGEFVAITGESGSGKSTLAHVISGILPYESGEMLLRGHPTSHYDSGDWERHRREQISFISQNYGILPGNTVLRNVLTALRITGMEADEAAQRAEELLKLVELWDLRGRRAGKLSSGQKQRLSVARALAKPAPILVADEPTGNLDPENSAKVMSLLAQAARDRLVILITHDFQEVEGLATRRIVLQDGRVVADASLQPSAPVEQTRRPRGVRKALGSFVARLQVTGRPVWSALSLLLFTLTAFGVFTFLGTFLRHLDDTPTRIYDDSAFPNGEMTRIIVQRSDLQPMTQEDWLRILSADHALMLERNSYLADWHYAWQEGVDYTLMYAVEHRGTDDDTYAITRKTAFLMTDNFLKTVPLYADGREFLTAGRLPENMYEVVAAGSQDLLGTRIPVYLNDPKNWGSGSYVVIDATVVGVTDQGTGLYMADELSRVICNHIAGGGTENGMFLIAPTYGSYATIDSQIIQHDFLTAGRIPRTVGEVVVPGPETLIGTWLPSIEAQIVGVTDQGAGMYVDMELDPAILEDATIPEAERAILETLVNQLLFRTRYANEAATTPDCADLYLAGQRTATLSRSLYERRKELADRYKENVSVTLYDLSDPNAEPGALDRLVYLDVISFNESTFNGFVNVTPELFYAISRDATANQVSLTITDYAYTDQTLEQLQDMGYLAMSVYRQGATAKDPLLARQRMTTLQVCLATLAAVILLQVLVLKELFGIQTGSYKLLADMGLSCGDAQRSILWQVLSFTALGQLLAFGAIALCGLLQVERILDILRYLSPSGWLLLSGAHLAISVLTGLLTMGTLRKRVYPQSARRDDLDLEEVETV